MKAWEANVRKVVPYTPGEQPNRPGMIKLNTNENPYPPAPGVRKALEELDIDRLRLYPDPAASELVNALAEYYHKDPSCIFVGVGSDDVIAMAFQTFFNSDKPILFPDISYSFYSVWADLFGIRYERPALDENFRIVKKDYFKENGGIIFPNPNAPTGIYMELSEVEEIIAKNPESIVIVDEAYVDFAGPSALELVDKYDNLLVVQTFSKSRSMAGMRIGFAIGQPELIKYLNDVKYSFNSYTMNLPSLKLGAAAVKDEAYFRETVGKIVATRERVKKELAELGFTFPDSRSNFIFATHKEWPAKELFEELKKEDIYVRYFASPRIDNYLRITVGTDEEMDALLAFLRKKGN
ncbi:histidinol-phosphate transaminase [Laedolimicola ammoniilytica]|uniref:Histidinol-phosphate aminotransferase n=1 Tax=Laedolimicola ammoniilytica TaxID=2981771 RepID=A0ABT2RTR5_9FIRM|nr:histidinol-phosphate transaminase [Laedolimicola ammoniilytica]MCU6695705.1 histidinol-phosphate transaminase [Laedolimicola ammoniilytica]SCH15695.1 Histidinol-phosphate aminotransferase [uncultured Clostridium sp.]